MNQRKLVSGVFLVEIHLWSPACTGMLLPDRDHFPDQSTIAATRRRSSKVESMAEDTICRAMGSLPVGLLRGEIAWRLAAPVVIQFIFSLQAAV